MVALEYHLVEKPWNFQNDENALIGITFIIFKGFRGHQWGHRGVTRALTSMIGGVDALGEEAINALLIIQGVP